MTELREVDHQCWGDVRVDRHSSWPCSQGFSVREGDDKNNGF